MATHDKYENDILKSLQKIARHLESIDKKMFNQNADEELNIFEMVKGETKYKEGDCR